MLRKQNAVLIFEDGFRLEGKPFAATGTVIGAAGYCTRITGYQEVFSDPLYRDQILVMTAPHIGNVGVNEADFTAPGYAIGGVVIREAPRLTSSHLATGDLETALATAGVVGICEVDTRVLTLHLRDNPTLWAGIFSFQDLTEEPYSSSYQVDSLISQVKEAKVGREICQ